MECFFIQFQWGFFFCSSTTTYSSSWSSWPGWSDWSSWSDWSYRSYRSLPLPTQFLLLTTPEMPCTTKNGVWFCSVSFSFLISFWLHNQPSSVSVFLISVGSFLWVTPIHSKRKKKKRQINNNNNNNNNNCRHLKHWQTWWVWNTRNLLKKIEKTEKRIYIPWRFCVSFSLVFFSCFSRVD